MEQTDTPILEDQQVEPTIEKKQKNPKRVEQGRKLAEWNKANKQRSIPPQTKPATVLPTDDTTLKQTSVHKPATKDSAKDSAKDYVLLAETILIIGLGAALLFCYTKDKTQPKSQPEVSVKTRSESGVKAVSRSAHPDEDDLFDM